MLIWWTDWIVSVKWRILYLTKLQSRWKAVGKWPELYCSAGRQSTRKKRTHSMLSTLCVDSAFSTNSWADTGRHKACEMLDVSVDSSLSPYNTFNRSCTENCHNYQVSELLKLKVVHKMRKKFSFNLKPYKTDWNLIKYLKIYLMKLILLAIYSAAIANMAK
jgi:hypothetical protein